MCVFKISKNRVRNHPSKLEIKAEHTKKSKAIKPGYKLSDQLMTLNYTCMGVRPQGDQWKAETPGRLKDPRRDFNSCPLQGNSLELESCSVRGMIVGFH